MKAIKILLAVTIAACLAGLAVILWIYRDIPAEVLEARYGSPASQFIMIDGVRLHYRDEGRGQPVVLIHGHWGSLLQWDAWMPALGQNHRVIRFDLPSHGLTGVDPTGDYTNERAVSLLEQFLDQLDLAEFHIAGTSIGGMVAYKYTAAHAERVLSLALINSGGLKVTNRAPDERLKMPWWIDILAYYTPKSLVENILRGVAGDPQSIPSEVVDQWYELNMREGQREAEIARNRQFTTGRTIEELNSIVAPTLLMWGEANRNLPISQVGEFKKHLSKAPVSVVTYAGVGHNVTYENPQDSAKDYLQFLKAAGPAPMSPTP
jgi:pimeloyl-ACP methyl ester carboxylesterase